MAVPLPQDEKEHKNVVVALSRARFGDKVSYVANGKRYTLTPRRIFSKKGK